MYILLQDASELSDALEAAEKFPELKDSDDYEQLLALKAQAAPAPVKKKVTAVATKKTVSAVAVKKTASATVCPRPPFTCAAQIVVE